MSVKINKQTIQVKGEELLAKIRGIIDEGNASRIIIQNKEGKTLIEIPLTVGVVGGVASVVFLPILAAIGALAAMITDCTLVVERPEEKPSKDKVVDVAVQKSESKGENQ